ncbi:MAG: DNA cytosine methyltransferase [Cyanobacteria bacterium J06614_10]
MTQVSCLEICAGAGGQALGIEQAGFTPEALVEIDKACCNTLRFNRPRWNVIEGDIREFDGASFKGIDLLAGGVPCPPFSKAGKQLGTRDERDLFPEALRLIDECRPRTVMLENVRGFLDPRFEEYRLLLKSKLEKMGYNVDWKILNASDFGVSQLRPRVVIVAIKRALSGSFLWPKSFQQRPQTVGQLLYDQMAVNGWKGAEDWRQQANDIAPTLVGGSKKHGGPDLGPTRAKRAWAKLGVDGMGIANDSPACNFDGMPRLTVPMAARIQGFPDTWHFVGKKTPTYRQVGNAFPPPVSQAVASAIYTSLSRQTVFSISR